MKISEMIAKLQRIQDKEGDRDVVVLGEKGKVSKDPEFCTHYDQLEDLDKFSISLSC